MISDLLRHADLTGLGKKRDHEGQLLRLIQDIAVCDHLSHIPSVIELVTHSIAAQRMKLTRRMIASLAITAMAAANQTTFPWSHSLRGRIACLQAEVRFWATRDSKACLKRKCPGKVGRMSLRHPPTCPEQTKPFWGKQTQTNCCLTFKLVYRTWAVCLTAVSGRSASPSLV